MGVQELHQTAILYGGCDDCFQVYETGEDGLGLQVLCAKNLHADVWTSESKYDYMKSANETINAIRKYVDEETFNKVTECQRTLRKFLKGNNGVIEKVRSNNEAYKTYNVDELFATVEELSVKDSLTWIEEYKRLLMDFFGALCEVHFAIERYNERARWVIMPSGFLAGGLL